MQEGSSCEPREERRVLDWIPSPIAAPAQYRVCPVSTEENPAGEEAPGDHRPAARNVNPFLAGILHDQCAECKGKRHSESNVSEVQHRGMNHHLRILEQRIKPIAIWRNRPAYE